MSANDLASKSLSSVSSLIGLQLFSRAFTFILNQILVRVASPEVFGTATIQFELLLSTILFLSREGVRNALLRSSTTPNNPDDKSRSPLLVSNVATLPVLIGAPLAVTATVAYRSLSSISTRSQPHFDLAIFIYALSAFVELLSEPLYVRAQSELRLGVRVRAEGTGVVARAVITVLAILFLGPSWSLVAFALGQAGYACAVLSVYTLEERGIGRTSIWPKRVEGKVQGKTEHSYFEPELFRLSRAMTAQSVVKHFLTEGDRLLVAKLSPLQDQGGYAVATNYGSLVARIIFQPIEETSRLFFSKSLALEPSTQALEQGSTIATTALRLYTHLAIVFLAFGPPYIPTVLSFLLPARYLATSAPRVLRAYCVYLPVMSLNGFLEAFFSSTAAPSDLGRQSRAMIGFSVLFIFAAWTLSEGLGWRETGLVYANCLNLGVRALYGWAHLRRYFARHQSSNVTMRGAFIPHLGVTIASLSVAAITRVSEAKLGGPTLQQRALHLGVGAVCFVVWAGLCLFSEPQLLNGIKGLIRKKIKVA